MCGGDTKRIRLWPVAQQAYCSLFYPYTILPKAHPIYFADRTACSEMVKLLLEAGANPNLGDEMHMIPL